MPTDSAEDKSDSGRRSAAEDEKPRKSYFSSRKRAYALDSTPTIC